MNWQENKLSNLCSKITDGTHDSPKSVSNGFPYIKGTHLKNGLIDFDNCEYLDEKDHSKVISRSKPEKGDILFANIGNIGECAYVNVDFEFSIKNVALFKPNKEFLNGKFLYYLLSSDLIQRDIKNRKSGSAQPFLSLSVLRNYIIAYPPLQTQKSIANILSSYDDLIENNLKRINILQKAAQNIYKEWFINMRFPGHQNSVTDDVTGLPEGWKSVNLYDFAEVQMGYPFKAKDFNDKMQGIPAVRIRDIPNNWTKTYTTEIVNQKYFISCGDILIGMDGLFHLDLWGGQENALLVQRVCRLRAINKELQGYLLQALHQPIKYFERTISGATVAHLGAKHLKEIYIVVPNDSFLEYLSVFEVFNSQIILLNKQNRKLKEARDVLLPRLMNQTIKV